MIVIDILDASENMNTGSIQEELIDIRDLPELTLQIVEVEPTKIIELPWLIIEKIKETNGRM